MSVGFCDNRCNVNYLYRLYRNHWLKHIRLDSEWQSNDYDYITDVNNVQNVHDTSNIPVILDSIVMQSSSKKPFCLIKGSSLR